MTRKREVLSHLTRDELHAAIDAAGLELANRRAKSAAIDVLDRARSAPLVDVLTVLSRDRLKELCREFALDDYGRAKSDHIARLVDTSSKAAAAAKVNQVFASDDLRPRGVASRPPAARAPEFGIMLRKARRDAKLTLEDVSRRLGVSVSYLSAVETGRMKPPTMAVVAEAERVLGFEAGALVRAASRAGRSVDLSSDRPDVQELALALSRGGDRLSKKTVRELLGIVMAELG